MMSTVTMATPVSDIVKAAPNKGSMDDHIKKGKTEAALQNHIQHSRQQRLQPTRIENNLETGRNMHHTNYTICSRNIDNHNKRNRTATKDIGQHNKKDTLNTTN